MPPSTARRPAHAWLTTSLLFITLLAPISARQDVSHAADPEWDPSRARTWSWMDDRGTSPLHDRLAAQIAAELGRRGLVQADARAAGPAAAADVLVAFDVVTADEVGIVLLPLAHEPFGRSSRTASARGTSARVVTVTIGIVDARSGRMRWRAAATADGGTGGAPVGGTAQVTRLVAKMFARYPSGAGTHRPR